MKKRKIFLYIIVSAIICFVAIPLIVNWMFKNSAPLAILQAEWGAGEAMGYISGMMSFIGTIFLGGVSWKQNNDLQKRQDETFIAENSCGVLLEKVNFRIGPQNACNFELHPETIVCSNRLTENGLDYKSFECEITLHHTKNVPVLVRVLSAFMFVGNQIVEFEKYDDCFTRVAVFKDVSKFNLTLLMPIKEKQLVGKMIMDGKYQITLAINLELVSDRYVLTTWKCRSILQYSNSSNEIKYTSCDDASMGFWYGNRIIEQSEIKYRVQQSSGQGGET